MEATAVLPLLWTSVSFRQFLLEHLLVTLMCQELRNGTNTAAAAAADAAQEAPLFAKSDFDWSLQGAAS